MTETSFTAGYSWAYNAQLYHDTYYPDFNVGLYLFFTSLIGGSIGIIMGGIVSDRIVKKVGVQARAWVLAVSQVTSSVSPVEGRLHIFFFFLLVGS